MSRFRLSTLFLLIVTICVAAAWFVDRRHLQQELNEQRPLVRYYCEKPGLWSPAEFLYTDTDTIELRLASHVDEFAGDFVKSSQGIGNRRLRQPTLETLNAVTALLDEDDSSLRADAAALIALYLESVSGSENQDDASLLLRAHFQLHGLTKAKALMSDDNVTVRQAVALIFGNTFRSRDTEQFVKDAFDKEVVQGVRIHLAWSYYNLTR